MGVYESMREIEKEEIIMTNSVDSIIKDQNFIERLENIERFNRYWRVDELSQEGIEKITEDIDWLILQALKSYRYGIALRSIEKRIDDKESVQEIISRALGK